MGYVPSGPRRRGNAVNLMVRGKALGASVTALPFVPTATR
jgi:hypothetical protein